MAYTEWQVGGRSVGGLMLKPPMMPAEVPPHWAVYFSVADTDAAVVRVAELGGSVMVPADGHRARPLRGGRRSHRRRLQRDRAEARAAG